MRWAIRTMDHQTEGGKDSDWEDDGEPEVGGVPPAVEVEDLVGILP